MPAKIRAGTKGTCRHCLKPVGWMESPLLEGSGVVCHWYHLNPDLKTILEYSPRYCQLTDLEVRQILGYAEGQEFDPTIRAQRHKYTQAEPIEFCVEMVRDEYGSHQCNRKAVDEETFLCGTHLRFERQGKRETEDVNKRNDGFRYTEETLSPIFKELDEVWQLKPELLLGYIDGQRQHNGRVAVDAHRLLELINVSTQNRVFKDQEASFR